MKRFGLLCLAALSAPLLFAQVQISGPTMVIGGTVGSPGGSTGALQYNGGGSFAGATITTDGTNLNATAGNIMGYTVGGARYAVDAQTGGGNNGIANAAATNQVVVADPTYPTTEQYSPTSTIPSWPNFTLQDLRGGHNLFLMHNPPTTYQPYGDANNADSLFYVQHDGAPAWGSGSLFQIGQRVYLNSTTPGQNFDYPPYDGLGWQLTQGLSVQGNVSGSGIAELLDVGINKYGSGDQVAAYLHNFSYNGGATGRSDEGKKALGATQQQAVAVYSGTNTSGAATSPALIRTTCRSATNACGPPIVAGPGGYAIDSTQTPITNAITNMVNSPLSTSTMSALTMGTTVPVSNGWGTQQANIVAPNRMYCYYSTSALTAAANASGGNTVYTGTITNGANSALAGCAVSIAGFGNSANNGAFTVVSSTATTLTLNNASGASQTGSATETVYTFAAMETFAVTLVGGSGFDATHEMCFATTYHECVVPTAAVNAGGGTWNITAPLRHAHDSGGYVFQGGMAGYAMNITAYDVTNGGMTMRYMFDVLGSTDASTLQTTWWFQGRPNVINSLSNLNINNSLYGCANATNVSNSGTAVTASFSTFCSTNFGALPDYTGATFYFSGGSNSTINGNCTNVTWTNSSTFTCTNATASGSNSGMTATFQLGTAGQNGINVVQLRPASEILDVQDYTVTPPAVNGVLALEPNPNFVTALNDVIEEGKVAADITNGAVISNNTTNPYMYEHGLSVGLGASPGTQIGGYPQGGGLSTSTSNSSLSIGTSGVSTPYKGQGGFFIPPNMVNLMGPYFIGLDFDHGPTLNQGIMTVLHTGTQVGDPNYCYRVWDIYELSNQPFYLKNCPNTLAVTMVTSGLYTVNPASFALNTAGTATYTASSHTFNGNVILNGTANAIGGVNLSTTGGMFSGQGMNYAPNSNTLTASTWQVLGGSGTTACSITDDLGDPACTLTATSSTYAWEDSNIGVLTPLTLNASYVVQIRARGHAGGELVTIGADQVGSNKTMTTSWANYCAVVTATNSGSFLNRLANVTLNANSAVVDVANVITVPGNSCSPAPLQLTTLNNQYTTLTNINHTATFDSNAYTLSGAATNTAGGLAALNGSAVLPTAQEGTGTPAAGKYVDGAAGAWTAVPTTPIRAGNWTISASTTVAVTFSTAMGSTPSSCSVTPSASSATTGQPFATSLSTTGFTVNVPTSGTLSGTYLCAINNAF